MKLMKKLRRHPWLAGATGGCVFGALTSFAVFLPQMHSSSATLLVTRPENFSLESVNREVLSDTNIEKLIKEFGLSNESSINNGTIDRIRRAITVEFPEDGRSDKMSFIVSFRGADPQKTIDVTNALASLYAEHNSMGRELSASEASRASQEEREQITQQIEEQKRQIQQYKDRYRKELPDQLDTNRKAVASLHEQIKTLTDDLRHKRDQRAALVNKTTRFGEAKPKNTDVALASLISYASDLRKELTQLRERHSDTHPDIRRVQQELGSLEARIKLRSKWTREKNHGEQRQGKAADENVSTSLRELDSQITQAEDKRRKLEQQLHEYQKYIDNTSKREKELQALILANKIFEEKSALNRTLSNDNAGTEIEKGGEIRILHSATYPAASLGPRRFSLFLAALSFGIGVAFGSVVIWEKWIDTSFHSETELESATQLPVLVSIPRIAGAGVQIPRVESSETLWRSGEHAPMTDDRQE